MATIPIEQPSSYAEFLPAVYRQGETRQAANFTGRFLKIFEKLLSGIQDGVVTGFPLPDGTTVSVNVPGVEETLDRIHEFFDPLFTAPFVEPRADEEDFLRYLGAWVALTFNQNWPLSRKRRVLQKIVPLYKKRGTREGLTEYLRIFVGPNVFIEEQLQGLQIGVSSTVGQDTIVGGAPPYFFFVRISLREQDLTPEKEVSLFLRNLLQLTAEIIDLEKPAHTTYAIRYDVPGIIVGRLSHVGVDTLIGSRSIPLLI